MLLAITKSVTLAAPVDAVWELIRDPERVAACLANLRDFRPTGEAGRYSTLLVERLGPFGVQVGLTIAVEQDEAARTMIAHVSGEDRGGAARVRGDVRATVSAAPAGKGGDLTGSALEIVSDVEVLGRLASLGAVPMRRRGDQVFDQFVANIAALLEEPRG
jgi:carbon monoxide dehydrogenase subunit G